MNPEFEEWLNGGILDAASDGDANDIEFIIREAYKLGLQRGHDGVHDSVVCAANIAELNELNKED